ncbi:restriction endonuclease [Chryseobacterium sp. TY4]
MRKKFIKKEKAKRKHLKHLEKIASRNTVTNTPGKVRLNRAVKELNMSMSSIIEILSRNNISVEYNPNAMLSEEAIRVLFEKEFDENPIFLSDPTYDILEWIREDIKNLDRITPDNFENLIITLLIKKGYSVEKSGRTNQADGGIDVIAYKKNIVNIIIAVQIKYKINTDKKVTTGEVRDFVGAMKLVDYFNAGMLVTNTFFTEDSKWLEGKEFNLELKDSHDIQNWLKDNFVTNKKIDKELELTSKNSIYLNF